MKKAVMTKAYVEERVLKDEPIEVHGLKIYALPMSAYIDWLNCRSFLLARQAKFPVSYSSMTYLEAVFALDIDCLKRTGKLAGWMQAILHCIALSLGLQKDSVDKEEITITTDETGERLKSILVKRHGMNDVHITPGQFNNLRKTIAWAQGDDLPDESLNDELLEAEQEIAGRNAPRLDYNLTSLKASVALACGKRIMDVDKWSILEFEEMRKAIDRSKKHLLCAIASAQGAKWDGGNPHPSWCYDRIAGSGALVSGERFKGL
ncbi:MAG: hypothetical protein IIX10_02220 [Clostridia bacterium]|nr:hypothetical protein [Clostridia bacterium]